MEIDLERVPRVAGRLLEVDAVGKDLALALVHQNSRAEHAPTVRARQVWEEQPGVEEAEGLAREMRVR